MLKARHRRRGAHTKYTHHLIHLGKTRGPPMKQGKDQETKQKTKDRKILTWSVTSFESG